MTAPHTKTEENTSMESFEALLNETPLASMDLVGTVIKGVVVNIIGDSAIIDVGLKSEGRVPLKEFAYGAKAPEIKKFDEIDVYIERMEDKDGMIGLSLVRSLVVLKAALPLILRALLPSYPVANSMYVPLRM